jgi:hypothetical protein
MKAIVVPRGLDPSYYFFTEITATVNGMAFIIDRRRVERRRGAQIARLERRTSGRRTDLPASWARDGFIVVGAAATA